MASDSGKIGDIHMKKSALYVAADAGRCTGCKACELACFAEHNHTSNRVGKTVGTATVPVTAGLYLVKRDGLCLPIQCKHCEDAPCLHACARRAIVRLDGQIIINEERCIGCRDCVMACPFGAVTIAPVFAKGEPVNLPGSSLQRKAATKCDLCIGKEGGPACVRTCPNKALRVVDADEERAAKSLKAAEALMLPK